MKFLFRDEEMGRLESISLDARQSGRIAWICGRTGIGKSRLASEFLKKRSGSSIKVSLKKFSSADDVIKSIMDAMRDAAGIRQTPSCLTIAQAFDYVLDIARTSDILVCLDGADELEQAEKGFWTEFSKVWNEKCDKIRIFFIFCLIDQKNDFLESFENSEKIELQPFSLRQIRQILKKDGKNENSEDVILLHALTGGVPGYVRTFVDQGVTGLEQFEELFRNPDSYFALEGERLLNGTFFSSFGVYASILRKISLGCEKRAELQQEFRVNVGGYLSKLEHDFCLVCRAEDVKTKKMSKKCRWRIADPFLDAWLSVLDGGEPLKDYLGRRFSGIAAEWLRETGLFQEVGSWRDSRRQCGLPLIGIARDGATVFLPGMWEEIPRSADFDRALRIFSETAEIPLHRIRQKALSSQNLFLLDS